MIFNRVSLLFDENKTIFWGLLVSLMFHALIFVFSGTRTFIPKAQFSVQTSMQMVEVSIVSENPISVVSLRGAQRATKQSFNSKKIATPRQGGARNDTGSGVRAKANPNYFQNPAPEYPTLAKQMRQEGLVLLSVDVDRDGLPIKVEIIKSSGFHMLDQAAIMAVSHWRFQPGRTGNLPIESVVTIPIRFTLEKEGS